MKTCGTFHEKIALLAAGSLDERSQPEVRQHLQTCRDCQAYWDEMQRVCAAQRLAAANLPAVSPSPTFHARLRAKVLQSESPPFTREMHLWWRWFVLRPASALALGVLVSSLAFVLVMRPKRMPLPAGPESIESTDQPTFATYRRAIDESPESLEVLLERDAEWILNLEEVNRLSDARLAATE